MTEYRFFGLRQNPFTHHLFEAHLVRAVDLELAALLERVRTSNGEKVALALAGAAGAGKTETLRILERTAVKAGVFCLFADGQQTSATAPGERTEGPVTRRWRRGKREPASEKASLAELSRHQPALLILDNLADTQRVTAVLALLKAGMVVFCSEDSFAHEFPLLTIPPLSDAEAEQLVAKRLELYRYSRDMDPLYPFTRSFIAALNQRTHGNPGSLIEQLARILTQAADRKVLILNRLQEEE
jgi:hypothetical protein